MEFLRKFWKNVTAFRKPQAHTNKELTPEQVIESRLKPYRHYLFKIQDVLMWEVPYESVLALVAVNGLFWFLAHLEWRFLGLLFTTLLAYVVYEAWAVHIWPEIRVSKPNELGPNQATEGFEKQEGKLSIPELSQYAGCIRAAVSEQAARLRSLRGNQPGVFCFIICGIFLLMAGLGSTISGLGLLYIVVMMVLIIPGIFIHLIPPEVKERIFRCLQKVSSVIRPSEGSVDVEEYLPESSKENMELFALAGDIQPNSNAPSSSSSDDCLMASVMPSHEDSSMDALDSLSLDPSTPFLKQEGSSDTDSEVEAIHFKSTHFNGNDSSGDEGIKQIAKDLSFPDLAETSFQPAGLGDVITDTIAKNLTKLSGNLQLFRLASFVGASGGKPPLPVGNQTDDSDSEFEMIENEDVS